MSREENKADIEATVCFLTHQSGGRHAPVASGYRGQFFYDNNDWDATHLYPDTEWVQPGQKVRSRLRFTSPDLHLGKIYEGMPFLIREGSKTIAYGVVTKILDRTASAASSNTS